MREKRLSRDRLAGALGLPVALGLTAYFFRAHPPRPAFGGPAPCDGAFPIGVHAASLLGAALFGLLLLAAGTGLRRLLRAGRGDGGASFALGAAYCSMLSLLLLTMGAFRLWILVPLLFLPALLAGPPRMPGLPKPIRPGPGEAAGAVLLALALADLLVRALAPLTANDPIVYHMTLARGYAAAGGLDGAPDLIYAKMPHGGDLLYAGASLFGGEGAARLFHVLLAAAGARLAASLARALRPGSSGLPAAALFLTLPLVLDSRIVGDVDLAAVLFFGGALLGIVPRGRSRGDLIGASLLAGALLTVKYSALAAYVPLALALFLPAFGPARRGGRGGRIALFAALSLAFFLPWGLKAWVQTGNPLFPLLPRLLGGRGWDPVLDGRLFAWQQSIGMGRGVADWLLLPWNVVFHGQPRYDGFDGVLSPVLLLWGFWAAARGGSAARAALILVLVGLLLWGLGSQQLRFLLPLVLLLAAVAGAWWRTERGWPGAAQATLFFGVAALLLAPALRETARDTLPVVLGRERSEAYLERKIQSYEAFRSLDRVVPEGERVALLWENRVYYSPRPWIADSFFEASEMARRAEIAGSADRFLAALRAEGASWILVNHALGGAFARFSSAEALSVMEGALRRSESAGAWKGLELYRIPADSALQ
ncbi:MAG: hypothetical protein ABIK65_03370 [Candidatus Eisenbacteria bacterium]